MSVLDPDAYAMKEFGTRGEKIKFIVAQMPEEFHELKSSYQAVGKALTRYGFDTTYLAASNITVKAVKDGKVLIRLLHLCKTVTDVEKDKPTEEQEKRSVKAIKARGLAADTRKRINEAKTDPEQYLFKLLLDGKITKAQLDLVSGDRESAILFISDLLEKEASNVSGTDDTNRT